MSFMHESKAVKARGHKSNLSAEDLAAGLHGQYLDGIITLDAYLASLDSLSTMPGCKSLAKRALLVRQYHFVIDAIASPPNSPDQIAQLVREGKELRLSKKDLCENLQEGWQIKRQELTSSLQESLVPKDAPRWLCDLWMHYEHSARLAHYLPQKGQPSSQDYLTQRTQELSQLKLNADLLYPVLSEFSEKHYLEFCPHFQTNSKASKKLALLISEENIFFSTVEGISNYSKEVDGIVLTQLKLLAEIEPRNRGEAFYHAVLSCAGLLALCFYEDSQRPTNTQRGPQNPEPKRDNLHDCEDLRYQAYLHLVPDSTSLPPMRSPRSRQNGTNGTSPQFETVIALLETSRSVA